MDRGAWPATGHGATNSWTQLSNWTHTHTHTHSIKLLIVHIIYYKGKGEKGNVWNSPYLLWNISEKFTFISLLTSFSLKFFKMRWLILGNKASQMALWVENLLAMQETWEMQIWLFLGQEDPKPLPVFWRIPWRDEPGGLQSIGLQRAGHHWSDWTCTRVRFGSDLKELTITKIYKIERENVLDMIGQCLRVIVAGRKNMSQHRAADLKSKQCTFQVHL